MLEVIPGPQELAKLHRTTCAAHDFMFRTLCKPCLKSWAAPHSPAALCFCHPPSEMCLSTRPVKGYASLPVPASWQGHCQACCMISSCDTAACLKSKHFDSKVQNRKANFAHLRTSWAMQMSTAVDAHSLCDHAAQHSTVLSHTCR